MKLTGETIKLITLFENISGARVKDCLFGEENELIFIVEEGHIKKALAYAGKAEIMLKKKVKILGFSNNLPKFVNNLLYPVKVDVRQDGKIVTLICGDPKLKGKVFGRGRERLRWINDIIKKYFSVEEVVVE